MINEGDILIRLALAALLGAIVGIERERQNQPAGLRTHTILSVGSALAMVLSINIAIVYRPFVLNGDPARLAAQVISGIGFLGAGAILRYGTNIKGLTTATSLWTVAIVGLAAGSGAYIAAAGATLLILIVLTLLNWIEKRFIRAYDTRAISLLAADSPGLIEEFRQALRDLGEQIISFGISKDLENGLMQFEVVVKSLEAPRWEPVLDRLCALPGVKQVRIS